jgi:hypothetical protein
MPKILDLETEGMIKAYKERGLGPTAIVRVLGQNGIKTHRNTVINVLNCVGKIRESRLKGVKFKQKRRRLKRTKEVISKVAVEIKKQNPPTQKELADKYSQSKRSIQKIIHEDLNMETGKKRKVHQLNDRQKKNRRINCLKLLTNHLTKNNLEFVVTLDETWLYLTNCNAGSDICYVSRGEKIPQTCMNEKVERYDEKIMVVGVLTGRGVIPLFKVPNKTKIDSDYYVTYIVKPLVENYLTSMYGNDINKVFIHHDAAITHIEVYHRRT